MVILEVFVLVHDTDRSGAPGALEDIRTLVNSWSIPNETRIEQDELGEWIDDLSTWRTRFRFLPEPQLGVDESLAAVRDAIRAALSGDFAGLEQVVADQPPGISVGEAGIGFVARRHSASDTAIALVLTAAADRTLPRLRTCGDCGWAFYDSSRNNRRRWCAMDPAPGGRGCGAAAKSRNYRARKQHA